MSVSLDDAFASVLTNGNLGDAYTTGTPANLLTQAGAASISIVLTAAAATAERAVSTADLTNPVGVLAAVTAAGNLATCRASLAWLALAQRALQRL